MFRSDILSICLPARVCALPYSVWMCHQAPPVNASQVCSVEKKQSVRRKISTETIISQNVRGLKSDDRIDELMNIVHQRKCLAACIQETWRAGKEVLEHGAARILLSGLEVPLCPRGSQGVGIVLSPAGVESWKAAGATVHDDLGARVIATRLQVRDCQQRDVFIFLVSAYAPVGDAEQGVWDTFLESVDRCLSRMEHDDILVMGTDTNSSMGITVPDDNDKHTKPIGQFGARHQNAAGERFASYLSVSNMRAVTTFFKKKNYATWNHPRSKLPHQIDHIITAGKDLIRFTDAGVTDCLIDSDHRAVKCALRIMKRLKKQATASEQLTKLDCSSLRDSVTETKFCNTFCQKFQTSTEGTHYSRVASAMSEAAKEVLPKKKRSQPAWFEEEESSLLPLIKARNDAFNAYTSSRVTRSTKQRLTEARKKVKNAVTAAKNKWLIDKCKRLNEAAGARRGTKSCWDTVSLLKKGLSKVKPANERMMKKEDGTMCATPEENAGVFRRHFEALYKREPNFDAEVLDSLEQRVETGSGDMPSEEEIDKAIGKLKKTTPGISGLSSELFKALLAEKESAALLRKTVTDFWETEIPPEEWEKGRLCILPKKGDLSLPGNHRGIMLLEAAYKITAIILHGRLLQIEEGLNHETQCGFRPGRGTMDAIFTVKMAMKKRREHGLETWIMFLDLVKAFDRVPRQLLWGVMRKFGVNEKLVRLLVALHDHVEVQFTVSGITSFVCSTIGVKQGDVLGPVLFIFYLAAVMETWKKEHKRPLCVFRTKEDFVMTGRRWNSKGEVIEVPDSEYADDTAVLFISRQDTEHYAPLLMQHFHRWGLEVHSGNPSKKSKTEILFASARPQLYQNPDTFDNCDLSPIMIGDGNFLPIVAVFQYLGSMLARDSQDNEDVKSRIDLAAAAFGSLRDCLFSSPRICLEAKTIVFEGLILSILLYGAECWSLTEQCMRKIRVFISRCIRNMFRVTRKQTREYHISNEELRDRAGLLTADAYVMRHQLRWAGHVSRMDWSRLPRKMLSSWVPHKRLVGAPEFTYGRGLMKSIRRLNLDKNNWSAAASDKTSWRKLCRTIH